MDRTVHESRPTGRRFRFSPEVLDPTRIRTDKGDSVQLPSPLVMEFDDQLFLLLNRLREPPAFRLSRDLRRDLPDRRSKLPQGL